MLSWQIFQFLLLRFLYDFWRHFGVNYIILENRSLHPVFTCTCGHGSGSRACGESSYLPNEGGFTWAVKGFSYFWEPIPWLPLLSACLFCGIWIFLTFSSAFLLGPRNWGPRTERRIPLTFSLWGLFLVVLALTSYVYPSNSMPDICGCPLWVRVPLARPWK